MLHQKIAPISAEANNETDIDEAQIRAFVSSLFRHAKPGDGYFTPRHFANKQGHGAPKARWVEFGGDEFFDAVMFYARDAAKVPSGPAGRTFAPPVALFNVSGDEAIKAGNRHVSFSPAIAIDFDQNPAEGLAKLEAILGPASLVVETGGVDPNGVARRHAYWILREPARDALRRSQLVYARKCARILAGADKAADNLPLPMRWPGSLHTKVPGAVRQARIAADRREIEIDLADATSKLVAAVAAAGLTVDADRLDPSAPRAGFTTRTALPERELTFLAKRVPNKGLHWDDYRANQMAFYDASHGDAEGLEALHVWAAKDARYDDNEVDASWAHFRYSPPCYVNDYTLIKQLSPADGKGFLSMRAEVWFEPPAATSLRPVEAGTLPFITEIRVAHAFAKAYSDRVRFAHDVGSWYVWTGTRFERTGKDLVPHWAALFAQEAAGGADAGVKKASEKSNFVRGVLTLAKADPHIAAEAVKWDADPLVAGTPEGIVDLRTGELRRATPAEGVTRQLGASPSYDPWCPRWLQFLNEATGGDASMIRFLQQFIGYSLTGSTKEHALLFLYGGGGNGKGVLLNIVSRLLGDYATTADMATFIDNKYEGHSTSLAMLHGARLVTASETQQGRAWNEARVKAVTGGDPITARFMRADNFTFKPAFKLVIAGNHKPLLRNVDDAARRRFAMVPFNRKPQRVDRDLEAKLWEEAPGIMRWAIDGCLDWQRNGLVKPAAVIRETEAYFETQDVFTQWLDERIEPCATGFISSAELFASWAGRAKSANEDAGVQRGLSDRLIAKGFETDKKNNVRGFKNIRFRSQEP